MTTLAAQDGDRPVTSRDESKVACMSAVLGIANPAQHDAHALHF